MWIVSMRKYYMFMKLENIFYKMNILEIIRHDMHSELLHLPSVCQTKLFVYWVKYVFSLLTFIQNWILSCSKLWNISIPKLYYWMNVVRMTRQHYKHVDVANGVCPH